MFLWILVRILVNSVSTNSVEIKISLCSYSMKSLWNTHCIIKHDHKEMCSRWCMIDAAVTVATAHVAPSLGICWDAHVVEQVNFPQ